MAESQASRGPLRNNWSTLSGEDERQTLRKKMFNNGGVAAVQMECDDEQNRILHRTIKAVSEDFENMEFNTAIARLMEFVNFFTKRLFSKFTIS